MTIFLQLYKLHRFSITILRCTKFGIHLKVVVTAWSTQSFCRYWRKQRYCHLRWCHTPLCQKGPEIKKKVTLYPSMRISNNMYNPYFQYIKKIKCSSWVKNLPNVKLLYLARFAYRIWCCLYDGQLHLPGSPDLWLIQCTHWFPAGEFCWQWWHRVCWWSWAETDCGLRW